MKPAEGTETEAATEATSQTNTADEGSTTETNNEATTETTTTETAEGSEGKSEKVKDLLDDDTAAAAETAPEKYEAFTFPEKYEASESSIDTLSALSKELGLSQPDAQKVFDALVKEDSDREKHLNGIHSEWEKASMADPDIANNISTAKSVLKKYFAGEEVRSLIRMAGMGNHSGFIKALISIGKDTNEQPAISGEAPLAGNMEQKTEFNSYSDILDQPNLDKNGVKRRTNTAA